MHNDVVLVIVIGTALAFDFTNGFHDTANVVATSISTRAMPPRLAVGYAAMLNFAGAFISLAVAATVAQDVVSAGAITPTVVFAGLIGAISLTRLYLLAHFPMDLLGGWIAGGALLSVIVAVHVLRVDERLQAAGQTSPPPEPSAPRRVAVPLNRPGATEGAATPAPAPAGVGVNASSADPISAPARLDA